MKLLALNTEIPLKKKVHFWFPLLPYLVIFIGFSFLRYLLPILDSQLMHVFDLSKQLPAIAWQNILLKTLVLLTTIPCMAIFYAIGWLFNLFIAAFILRWPGENVYNVFILSKVPIPWLQDHYIPLRAGEAEAYLEELRDEEEEKENLDKPDYILLQVSLIWLSCWAFFGAVMYAIDHWSEEEVGFAQFILMFIFFSIPVVLLFVSSLTSPKEELDSYGIKINTKTYGKQKTVPYPATNNLTEYLILLFFIVSPNLIDTLNPKPVIVINEISFADKNINQTQPRITPIENNLSVLHLTVTLYNPGWEPTTFKPDFDGTVTVNNEVSNLSFTLLNSIKTDKPQDANQLKNTIHIAPGGMQLISVLAEIPEAQQPFSHPFDADTIKLNFTAFTTDNKRIYAEPKILR